MNTETKFTAPDIVCGGCATSIKNALGKVEGITQVEVDVPTKTVTIEHASSISPEQLAEKLDDIGFAVA